MIKTLPHTQTSHESDCQGHANDDIVMRALEIEVSQYLHKCVSSDLWRMWPTLKVSDKRNFLTDLS